MTAPENILVTGFGPFGVHSINASWEAVRLLPTSLDEYNIIVQEIPVSYDHIDKKIHLLWRQYNPKLVVHVGVSSFTQTLLLENCAYKEGYRQLDCFGCLPTSGDICPTECKELIITPGIRLQDICSDVNSEKAVTIAVSENAGRYLCEYIFYTSLSINPNQTLFVHVPALNEPYTAEELSVGLLNIIKSAIKQLHCKN